MTKMSQSAGMAVTSSRSFQPLTSLRSAYVPYSGISFGNLNDDGGSIKDINIFEKVQQQC